MKTVKEIFIPRLEEALGEPLDEPTHAGVAVMAHDTRRVLMIQRSLDQDDAPDVQGTWEFPGGTIEDGESPEEAAWREFSEETGLPRPDGETVDGWRSDDGVYQGFLFLVPTEADAFDELNPDGEAAEGDNPDDPGRRNPDISAWFTVEQMKNMGSAIRPEVRQMDWSVFDLEEDMTETQPEETEEEVAMRGDVDPVPFYALIAPEGAWSGDGRRFLENSMRSRPAPMPMTWQKFSTDGHGNAATVARFDKVWRYGGNIWGSGFVLMNAEANEWTSLVGEFGRFGVSVDADDLDQFSVEFDEEGRATFSDARMCSACTVSIPAFAEAFVALGEWSPEIADNLPEPSQEIPTIENDASLVASITFKDYSTEQRRKMAQDGSAIPIKNDDGEIVDGSYPIADCEDLKNAIQAIGRAADPAEVKSHIRSRKESIGCPDVDLPDTWALEAIFGQPVQEFVDVAPGRTMDGPGWLTHPVDTDRLRDYWVRGPGAAKIGWGTPGDFNRCRVNLAEYVKPQHLSGYCANRHFDALGYWPGQGPHAKGETIEMSDDTASIAEETEQGSLTAAAPRSGLPYSHFADPGLSGPTPLTVAGDRVFGHLATWGVCHIGFDGECVEAPHSLAEYAYFRTGQIQTDDGPVAVGNISMGGGHAAPHLGYRPAMSHYDETSSIVADIAVGEDEFGIWFSGAIREGVEQDDVDALSASGGLSGDWRLIGGNLELVAALAVNVPGFPVPRIQVAASAGQTTALVAAGVITEQDDEAQFAERVAARVKEILETERAHAVLRAKIVDEELADLRAKVEG